MGKRILIVSGMPPVPCNTGSRLRLYYAIEQMIQQKFVVFVVLVLNEDEAKNRNVIDEYFRKHGVAYQVITQQGQNRFSELIKRVGQGLFGKPMPLITSISNVIMQVVNEQHSDIVHLHKTVASSFVNIESLRAKHILTSVDEGGGVHYLAYAQEAEQASFPASLIWKRRAQRVFDYESTLLKRIDVVTSVSPSEMELILPRLGQNTKLFLCPNGIDEAILNPPPPPFSEREDALFFCGRLSYKPNADAVIFYQKEILPHLKPPIPTLIVAGDQCPHELRSALQGQPSINFLGYVDNIHSMFRKYRIMLNPVRLGGGTNLKLLEAMANGMACISTGMSADGICAEPEKHLLKADTSLQIADSINRLRNDSSLGERISRAGRDFVSKHYTWKQCFAPLMDYYRSA